MKFAAVAAAAVDGAASAAASPDVDRQKERLEKEIRAMNEQFVHLKALLESEKKARIEQVHVTRTLLISHGMCTNDRWA